MRCAPETVSISASVGKPAPRDRPLIDPRRAAALSRLLKIFANDTRLRLLHALERGEEVCVTDLADTVEMAPQAVSKQLQRLSDRGIFSARRDGTRLYYRIADPARLCATRARAPRRVGAHGRYEPDRRGRGIRPMSAAPIDLDRLLKLRLAVGRFGEMDQAGWWNTKEQLGALGADVLSRGFPRTHHFAQARSVFAAAAHRCAEVFDPPQCVTLWRLPEARCAACR